MGLKAYYLDIVTDKRNDCFASFVKFFLFCLSLIYGLALSIVIICNRLLRYRLSCKVISVGNITWGGTGKTPLVEAIARYLKQEGCKVAILTRGYKRKKESDERRWARDEGRGTMDEMMGDEAAMLAKNLGDVPVIVDADRKRAAEKAMKEHHATAVILDDGFQQWRIKKDLEIVAIDAMCPFGNGHMIPRGILREPLSSLKRADIVVITKTNLNPDTRKIKDVLRLINPGAVVFESIHAPISLYDLAQPQALLNLDLLKDKTVALVSGIASPESFEKLVKGLGINVGLSFPFSDHHRYTPEDSKNIEAQLQAAAIDTILTTEKDALRIGHGIFSSLRKVYVVKIEVQVTDNEEEFFNRIRRVCLS